MHYHLEIIMPPTADIKGAVEKILEPFSESREADENGDARYGFWDWYQLGGRYSGSKLEASLPPGRVEAFIAALNELKVTVSSVTWGKQEISPASQVDAVDALWREMCPGAGTVCPLFKHSGDGSVMDACAVSELPPALKAHAVIVATPNYENELAAEFMIRQSIWNGVTHHDAAWDGLVSSALQMHAKHVAHYAEDYRDKRTVKPDWLAVTVDYHS